MDTTGIKGVGGEYKVGIIGHEESKFDVIARAEAKQIITNILETALRHHPGKKIILVSGGCHLGGIDIWAEEIAQKLAVEKIIFYPKKRKWEPDGYKERNIKIAETSDEVHCIVVRKYPSNYKGLKFDLCYHCGTSRHKKSGGCWTGKYAEKLEKIVRWHEI